MTSVHRVDDLLRAGWSDRDIKALIASGEFERVRRGAVGRPPSDPHSARERHRRLIVGSIPGLHADAVLSHASAATLHGLPVEDRLLERVHITRSRSYGGRRDAVVHVHAAPFAADEITLLNGLPVTTLERTVIDVARTLGLDAGIMAADAALRTGLQREVLAGALGRAARRPGVRRARRVVLLADPRSESAGESVSRLRMVQHGLPVPVLQLEVFAPDGRLAGRSDFGWEDHATLGEFDGRAKYGVAAGAGAEATVWKEKLREDEIRDLCWQMVRWVWADLGRFESVAARLHRAYARGRPGQLRGSWRPAPLRTPPALLA